MVDFGEWMDASTFDKLVTLDGTEVGIVLEQSSTRTPQPQQQPHVTLMNALPAEDYDFNEIFNETVGIEKGEAEGGGQGGENNPGQDEQPQEDAEAPSSGTKGSRGKKKRKTCAKE